MMATRVEGAPQGATPPSSSLRERGLGRRVVFLIALATCSVLCTYSALGLLARVTPALFPGYNLPGFVTETIPSLGPILPGPEAPDENSAFTRRRNLLIIGLDKLRDEPFDRVYRTDTIMVATLEPNAKQAAILAFPRDLLIDIDLPAYAPPKDRINTSYYYGYISTDEDSIERGAEQLVHDMKRNFGIEIDYWVIVDFVGVQEIINAVGGICITVPEDLEVPLWRYSDSKDPSTITYVEFPPGPQCLDGYHSVAFGRNRGGELGDLGRIRRQQIVLQALFSKVFHGGFLEDPLGLWDAYNDTVRTNMSKGEILGLAPLVREAQGEIATYSLGADVNGVETATLGWYEGKSILTWNVGNVVSVLRQVFLEGTYANSTVEIWDGSGRASRDQAKALQNYLAYTRGLPDVRLAIETENPLPTTIVRVYGDEKLELAEDIATWIGIDLESIEQLEGGGATPDIMILTGQDFVVPDK